MSATLAILRLLSRGISLFDPAAGVVPVFGVFLYKFIKRCLCNIYTTRADKVTLLGALRPLCPLPEQALGLGWPYRE
jgi:hypothetical protein